MNISHIVFKELRQRKVRLITSILVIFLATAIIVSLQAISDSSKEAVTKQLRNLGANIFVLPRSLSVTNFYTANYGRAEMPETYFYKLTSSGLIKKEDIKAQLSSKIKINNHQAILTGVINESDPKGSHYRENEIFLGNEIAKLLNKKQGDQLIIKGKKFTIAKILSEKGTIDDIRIFAQLGTVQKLLKHGRIINTIEIISGVAKLVSRKAERPDKIGATPDKSGITGTESLARQIEVLLPDTKVVTKKRIAQTQANIIKALKKYSLLLLIIVFIVGGINIANYMFINVRERRREIGTLLAIGATPKIILNIFLQKAVLLGLAGGLTGYIFGTFLAVILGPKIIKIPVSPALGWCLWVIIIAVTFSVVSSYFPAKRAANLDPAVILQE